MTGQMHVAVGASCSATLEKIWPRHSGRIRRPSARDYFDQLPSSGDECPRRNIVRRRGVVSRVLPQARAEAEVAVRPERPAPADSSTDGSDVDGDEVASHPTTVVGDDDLGPSLDVGDCPEEQPAFPGGLAPAPPYQESEPADDVVDLAAGSADGPPDVGAVAAGAIAEVDPAGSAIPAPRARPGERAFMWHGFTISEVVRQGSRVGWGCGCNRHLNAGGDAGRCKKDITFGLAEYSDAQCIVALKRWLIGQRPKTSRSGTQQAVFNKLT